ncbi:MAG: protein-glutamate O-methyltransferase [Thermodesulfobacteriota bacterium]
MLDDNLFQKFRTLIYDQTGINLSSEKKELLNARLGKRLRACGLDSFTAYYELITSDRNGIEFTNFVDSVSTNYTSFFREQNHFTLLAERLLPEIIQRRSGGKPISIWSSACSSGEEPYTLAIVAQEALASSREKFQVFATDISTRVLAVAERGVYPMERVANVPREILKKYFLKGAGNSAGYVKVKPELRALIRFQHFNLMGPFPWRGEIDIVFCRNVMIYFDRETQTRLVNKFYDSLVAGGFLIIGHSESISSLNHRFRQVEATVFQK